MNLTLSTPAAIAVVIVLGLVLSSLFIVIICVAAQRLPGARFDEHQAEADALATGPTLADYRAIVDKVRAEPGFDEYVDQVLAVVRAEDEPTQVLAPVVQLVHDDVPAADVIRINGAGRRDWLTEGAP